MSSDNNNNRVEWGFLLEDDSKGFGLTRDEYNILLDDIAQAVEEGNRKYGYGGAGYIDKDGNYHLPEYNDRYVNHISNNQSQKLIPRKKRRAKSKQSVEELMIEKGLLTVRKVIH